MNTISINHRARRVAAALLASGLAVPGVAAAQKDFYAPLILQLPAGPRSLSMGNTGVASRDDEVLFFNPAQIAVARGMSASAERYSATAGGGSLSSIAAFNGGGVAVGARVVNYELPTGAFAGNRGSMLDAGAPATSYEAMVALAQVLKGVRGGVSLKYAEDVEPNLRVSRPLLDLGLSHDFFRTYTVGFSVQDIGKSMTIPCELHEGGSSCLPEPLPFGAPDLRQTSLALPTRATLGIAHQQQAGIFDLAWTAAVSALRTDFLVPSGGAELNYSWLSGYDITVRGGARRPLAGEKPITAGAGFTMDRLTIDYAVETLAGNRLGHRFGLRIR